MDLWFLFSIACAVFYGGHSALVKHVMDRVHFFLITWACACFSMPIFFAVLYVQGLPDIQSGFMTYFLVSLVINFLTWPLFVLAIREADISLVMPLLAFTPVFILGVEWVLRSRFPGAAGLSGIALIVSGAYVLNLGSIRQGIFAPIRALMNNSGALYMLGVSVLWSVSATIEYFTVTHSSPYFYPTLLNGSLAILFTPFLYVFMNEPMKTVGRKGNWIWLLGVGSFWALMIIFQMMALDVTDLVNYVISIKRAGMIVSVLIGWLCFSEKHILFRMIGAVLMLIGVFFIRIG
jgi:drug/metabolite transporter (DMT)-like permease